MNIHICLLIAVIIISGGAAQKTHVSCEREYTKIGCYSTVGRPDVKDMQMLVNDRDTTSAQYHGYWLDWKNFGKSIHSLACRCSQEAKRLGYTYFSIRFYGECYGGKDFTKFQTLIQQGWRSSACMNQLFKSCNRDETEECVGEAFAAYVYELGKTNDTKDVDGGVTEWSDWAKCSATCGTGIQARERSCTNPVPKGDGQPCSEELSESKTCVIKECPIDGGFTEWSDFSVCSRDCGGGSRKRTRTCTDPKPAFGAKHCVGDTVETESCNTHKCPIDGSYSQWSDYSTCSTSCGGGTQARIRSCTNPTPQHGGKSCAGDSNQSRQCNMQFCPVNGKYSDWSSWETCSHSCGGGSTSRSRKCDNPAPAHGGAPCSDISVETATCNSNPCPVDGGFTRWSEYSKCSASCGRGTQTKTRSCTNPIPQHGGKNCEGELKQTQTCNTMYCPVDGQYGPWSFWEYCSKSCGSGYTSQSRTCDNPLPAHGGKTCVGESKRTKLCKTDPCPVDGGYSPWSEYNSCSKTCGSGSQSRSRTCDDPKPQHGGKDCSSLGDATETRSCNANKCPVNGEYGKWADWESCSKSCGEGSTTRYRKCNSPTPAHGGDPCSGPAFEMKSCSIQICPVDGGYSPWSEYNSCSKTCGSGSQSRSRTCDDPKPQHGGKDCSSLGDATQTRSCNTDSCTGSMSKEMTKYVCENKYLNINCGLGGRIVITYASFGRRSTRYCGWSPYFSKSCHAGSSHIQTVARCNNKQYCSVQASVKIFGDPCRGTDKYLEVKYKCRDGPYAGT